MLPPEALVGVMPLAPVLASQISPVERAFRVWVGAADFFYEFLPDGRAEAIVSPETTAQSYLRLIVRPLADYGTPYVHLVLSDGAFHRLIQLALDLREGLLDLRQSCILPKCPHL